MRKINIVNGDISAVVDMDEGMNVVSLIYKDVETVICDEERKKSGGTYAIPVLFPTPNRTSNNYYIFNGKKTETVMHGNARHSVFDVVENGKDFVLGRAFFGSIELCVRISISPDRIRWDFDVCNNGPETFPFSIALHPFFDKHVFKYLSSDIEEEMVTTPELIPTGKMIKLPSDYMDKKDIDSINLDTVFYSPRAVSSILYGPDFSMEIKGSDDFKHVVIYTNPEKEFVCVEPQTGSTDFVNLSQKGFEREANMLTVEPSGKKSLSVEFKFS